MGVSRLTAGPKSVTSFKLDIQQSTMFTQIIVGTHWFRKVELYAAKILRQAANGRNRGVKGLLHRIPR